MTSLQAFCVGVGVGSLIWTFVTLLIEWYLDR